MRSLAATLLALVHNRVELAGTELELGARLLVARLVWLLVVVGVSFLALTMLSVLVLVLAWDTHRIAAAVALTVLYAAGALAAAWRVRELGRGPTFLSGTLAELKRDLAALRGGS